MEKQPPVQLLALGGGKGHGVLVEGISDVLQQREFLCLARGADVLWLEPIAFTWLSTSFSAGTEKKASLHARFLLLRLKK